MTAREPKEPKKDHPGFNPRSEQFLAAVYLLVTHAEDEYNREFVLIKEGKNHFSKWWFLSKVKQAFGLNTASGVPYSAMRQHIINFAEDFGRDWSAEE